MIAASRLTSCLAVCLLLAACGKSPDTPDPAPTSTPERSVAQPADAGVTAERIVDADREPQN